MRRGNYYFILALVVSLAAIVFALGSPISKQFFDSTSESENGSSLASFIQNNQWLSQGASVNPNGKFYKFSTRDLPQQLELGEVQDQTVIFNQIGLTSGRIFSLEKAGFEELSSLALEKIPYPISIPGSSSRTILMQGDSRFFAISEDGRVFIIDSSSNPGGALDFEEYLANGLSNFSLNYHTFIEPELASRLIDGASWSDISSSLIAPIAPLDIEFNQQQKRLNISFKTSIGEPVVVRIFVRDSDASSIITLQSVVVIDEGSSNDNDENESFNDPSSDSPSGDGIDLDPTIDPISNVEPPNETLTEDLATETPSDGNSLTETGEPTVESEEPTIEIPTETPTETPVDPSGGGMTFATPTEDPTETATVEPTETPIDTATESPSEAPTQIPTDTPVDTPTEVVTEIPTETATEAPTETATEVPTETATEMPTETPGETPTENPTETPWETPTEVPAETAIEMPTETATEAPTETATEMPSETPTEVPTETATEMPTETATEAPTETATEVPTETATEAPTETATEVPTETPGETPTENPTETPWETPTEIPTETATEMPTETATEAPTETATEMPTETATEAPTETATETPTETVTETPTATESPTVTPTETITGTPTETPTGTPKYKCEDPDGQDITTSGTTKKLNSSDGSIVETQIDECLPLGEDKVEEVREHYCRDIGSEEGYEIGNYTQACGEGSCCFAGACSPSFCPSPTATPTITPTPTPTCGLEVPEGQYATEGESFTLTVYSTTQDDEGNFIKISTVNIQSKTKDSPAVNVAGTAMSWSESGRDDSLGSVDMQVSDHKWYGHGSKDTLCADNQSSTGMYSLTVNADFENGCSASKTVDFRVIYPDASDSSGVRFGVNVNKLHVKLTPKRIYVPIGMGKPPMTVMRYTCTGEVSCPDGKCIDAQPSVVVNDSGQYRNLASKEENFHKEQHTSNKNWTSQGGVADLWNWSKFQRRYSNLLRSNSKGNFSTSTAACESALQTLSTQIVRAANDYVKAVGGWLDSNNVSCWKEYAAKRSIGWTESQGGYHYYCGYVYRGGCPESISPPAFFW